MAQLRITDSKEEIPSRTRSTSSEPNPFAEAMADSRARNVAKAVNLPADAVNEHVNLIRRAAADADHGVQVSYPHEVEEYKNRKGEPATRWKPIPDERGNVKVLFKAKDKRKSKAKDKETVGLDDSSASVPA